jgi:hypothetical protein
MNTIFKVVGAVTIFWFIGGFDFAPKLIADIGNWDGVESINRLMQTGIRGITNQWNLKVGNAKALPNEQNLKLGSEICKDKTATPNARLSLKKYEAHLQAVDLKVRSPLQDKNPEVFCESIDNRMMSLGGELIYVPEWESAKGKALKIDMRSGETKIIDLTTDGQQSKP